MKANLIRIPRNPSDTLALGEAAGRCVASKAFLALVGPLGSGKTQFVKGVARGLEVPDWDLVASPTFNIVARYEGRLPLVHVDAYRLSSPEELVDLGFEEWVAERGVTAFEWADRAGPLLPPDRLEIRFDHQSETQRRLGFVATGPESRRILDMLEAS